MGRSGYVSASLRRLAFVAAAAAAIPGVSGDVAGEFDLSAVGACYVAPCGPGIATIEADAIGAGSTNVGAISHALKVGGIGYGTHTLVGSANHDFSLDTSGAGFIRVTGVGMAQPLQVDGAGWLLSTGSGRASIVHGSGAGGQAPRGYAWPSLQVQGNSDGVVHVIGAVVAAINTTANGSGGLASPPFVVFGDGSATLLDAAGDGTFAATGNGYAKIPITASGGAYHSRSGMAVVNIPLVGGGGGSVFQLLLGHANCDVTVVGCANGENQIIAQGGEIYASDVAAGVFVLTENKATAVTA